MEIAKLKLLIVEDCEDLIVLWKMLFSKEGLKAQFARSGKEAEAFVNEGFNPDILMTDFYLPDTTGTSLINKLRGKNPDIKCLVVTGNSNSDFKTMLPMDTDYLIKPVRFGKLKCALEKMADEASLSL